MSIILVKLCRFTYNARLSSSSPSDIGVSAKLSKLLSPGHFVFRPLAGLLLVFAHSVFFDCVFRYFATGHYVALSSLREIMNLSLVISTIQRTRNFPGFER